MKNTHAHRVVAWATEGPLATRGWVCHAQGGQVFHKGRKSRCTGFRQGHLVALRLCPDPPGVP